MKAPTPGQMTYARVRQQHLRIRMAEVPVEHAVSLPMPTLRWGTAGFGYFASPALRNPEGPTKLGSPDRWWVIDAGRGRLVVYALTSALPFDSTRTFPPVEGGVPVQSIAEIRQLQLDFDGAVDHVLDDFFAGRDVDSTARQRVLELLAKLVQPPLMDVYRALAPDFFAWLDA